MAQPIEQITAMMYDYCELFDTADFEAFSSRIRARSVASRRPRRAGCPPLDSTRTSTSTTACRARSTSRPTSSWTWTPHTTRRPSALDVTILQALPELPLQPIFSGRYLDRFTRVDGTWRWTRREVIGDLYGDLSRHVKSSRGPRRT